MKNKFEKLVKLTNSTLPKAHDLNTYKAADVVNFYLPPIFILLGLFVNLLIILVMRSSYFQKVSTSVYLMAGAINDVTSLLISLLPHWLYLNYPLIYRHANLTDGVCTFFNFYGYSNTDVTLIMTTLMTVDRAYVIKYPLQAAAINTVRRARYAVVGGVLIVSSKNLFLWFCSSMSPPESTERLCTVSPSGPHFIFFVKKVWPWMHHVFVMICLLVILISNVVIIVDVKRSAMTNGSTGGDITRRHSGAGHPASPSSRLRQMTAMLLAQSLATVLLTCPFNLYEHLSTQVPDLYTDPKKMAMNQLFFSLFFYMLYSNKIVNFFLYVISGCKFRLALKQVLSCGRGDASGRHCERKQTAGGTSTHLSVREGRTCLDSAEIVCLNDSQTSDKVSTETGGSPNWEGNGKVKSISCISTGDNHYDAMFRRQSYLTKSC